MLARIAVGLIHLRFAHEITPSPCVRRLAALPKIEFEVPQIAIKQLLGGAVDIERVQRPGLEVDDEQAVVVLRNLARHHDEIGRQRRGLGVGPGQVPRHEPQRRKQRKIQTEEVEDALNSMLRTDYVPLRDIEKLNRLADYYVDYYGFLNQVLSEC